VKRTRMSVARVNLFAFRWCQRVCIRSEILSTWSGNPPGRHH